jgi:hypothetical protein
MAKFNDISIGILVVMCIVVFIEAALIYYYYNVEHQIQSLDSLDLNGDGVVSRSELKQILKMHLEKKKKTPPTIDHVLKSARSGVLRGGLMGLISHGFEGAIAGGLILGIINPMVAGIEHLL